MKTKERGPCVSKKAVLRDMYKAYLTLNPLLATQAGVHTHDHRYAASYMKSYREQTIEFAKLYSAKLHLAFACTKAHKTRDEAYTLCLLHFLQQQTLFCSSSFHMLCVDHMFQNPMRDLLELVEIGRQPIRDSTAFESWKRRVGEFIKSLPELRSNLLEGVSAGIVSFRGTIEPLIAQLCSMHSQQLVVDYVIQPYQADYVIHAEQTIIHEAHELAKFLQDRYLPHCNTEPGLCRVRRGRQLYRLARQLNLDVDTKISVAFEFGSREIARIAANMRAVRTFMQGRHVTDFENTVLKHRDNRFRSEQDMLDCYSSKVASLTKLFFSRGLRCPAGFRDIIVKPTPPARADSSTSAFFVPGSVNGKGATSVFFVNTSNWKTALRSDVTSICLHEAVPGHAYQNRLIQLDTEIPDILKVVQYNSFLESYAFFVESCDTPDGYDTTSLNAFTTQNRFVQGAYAGDLLSIYSMLNVSMLRALRLVVDVGIHAKGWTLEESYRVMRHHLYDPNIVLRTEILRYACLPGQALTYAYPKRTLDKLFKLSQTPDKIQFINQLNTLAAVLPMPQTLALRNHV